jgi:hypothetical protein
MWETIFDYLFAGYVVVLEIFWVCMMFLCIKGLFERGGYWGDM